MKLLLIYLLRPSMVLESTHLYTSICMLSICPMRKKPEESSEMISQIVFGEQVNVLSEEESWLYVQCRKDGYKGWIDSKLVSKIEKPYQESSDVHYSLEPSYIVIGESDSIIITLGAFLPHYDGMTFYLNGMKYNFSGTAARPGDLHLTEALVEKLSKKYLNTPYLWGGKTPFGVDCSGFVQTIYRILGVNLPRDAKDQANKGLTVDFVNESMAGDLAFFTKKTNRISHVGIILDDNKIIHASGKVRIDSLDHQGIYNAENQSYTHHLKIIKRVL